MPRYQSSGARQSPLRSAGRTLRMTAIHPASIGVSASLVSMLTDEVYSGPVAPPTRCAPTAELVSSRPRGQGSIERPSGPARSAGRRRPAQAGSRRPAARSVLRWRRSFFAAQS